MANEELVAAIQAGEDRMGELWDQVERLVKWKAHRIMMAAEGLPGRGVEFEDLYHSGYLALVEAVKTYDPAAGAFSTWFMYYLSTAFAVAGGYRTRKGKNEPLSNALSLDTPLSDDSDSDTMMEVVADPDGQKPTQSVEEAIFQKQLREAVESVMGELPKQYREILDLRYLQGMTLAAVGNLKGVTAERIRSVENKALREVRKARYACRLRPFYDFDFYCGTGLGAFQHTGMSIQERYLIAEEEAQEREKRRRQEQGSKWQEEKVQKEVQGTIERIRHRAQEKVARMTPEEKRALLEKYGYA